jgi:hypothetical protein
MRKMGESAKMPFFFFLGEINGSGIYCKRNLYKKIRSKGMWARGRSWIQKETGRGKNMI